MTKTKDAPLLRRVQRVPALFSALYTFSLARSLHAMGQML